MQTWWEWVEEGGSDILELPHYNIQILQFLTKTIMRQGKQSSLTRIKEISETILEEAQILDLQMSYVQRAKGNHGNKIKGKQEKYYRIY